MPINTYEYLLIPTTYLPINDGSSSTPIDSSPAAPATAVAQAPAEAAPHRAESTLWRPNSAAEWEDSLHTQCYMLYQESCLT